MIAALDALRLPSAQLTDDERAAVERLLRAVEAHVRLKMERRGCEYLARTTSANVVSEAVRVIRAAGWSVQVQAMAEPSPLGGPPRVLGFVLSMAPTDAVYALADGPSVVLH